MVVKSTITGALLIFSAARLWEVHGLLVDFKHIIPQLNPAMIALVVIPSPHYGMTENHRQVFGPFGPHELAEITDLNLNHMLVKENNGIQRQVLRGSSNPALLGKVCEKRLDNLGGGLSVEVLAEAVKLHVLPGPAGIAVCGLVGIMLEPDGCPQRLDARVGLHPLAVFPRYDGKAIMVQGSSIHGVFLRVRIIRAARYAAWLRENTC